VLAEGAHPAAESTKDTAIKENVVVSLMFNLTAGAPSGAEMRLLCTPTLLSAIGAVGVRMFSYFFSSRMVGRGGGARLDQFDGFNGCGPPMNKSGQEQSFRGLDKTHKI
jgi:hypothetical protein